MILRRKRRRRKRHWKQWGVKKAKKVKKGGAWRPGLIFWNPQVSTDYFRFCETHVGIKSFQGKINLFQILPEPGIGLASILKVLHTVPRMTNIQLAD